MNQILKQEHKLTRRRGKRQLDIACISWRQRKQARFGELEAVSLGYSRKGLERH